MFLSPFNVYKVAQAIVFSALIMQSDEPISLPCDFLMGWIFPAPPSAVRIMSPFEMQGRAENGWTKGISLPTGRG
jgi:hypothetical protein